MSAANEVTNRFITTSVLEVLGLEKRWSARDRPPGHDRHTQSRPINPCLGWAQARFQALMDAVAWYRDNPGWWKILKRGVLTRASEASAMSDP